MAFYGRPVACRWWWCSCAISYLFSFSLSLCPSCSRFCRQTVLLIAAMIANSTCKIANSPVGFTIYPKICYQHAPNLEERERKEKGLQTSTKVLEKDNLQRGRYNALVPCLLCFGISRVPASFLSFEFLCSFQVLMFYS